jgi:hypothetical protein
MGKTSYINFVHIETDKIVKEISEERSYKIEKWIVDNVEIDDN